MKDNNTLKTGILSSRLPFRASRAALGLILATVFLAVLLSISTLQNINRAQNLMERFLLQKGETIITAVQAAMRTSFMHHMGQGDPLGMLLAESSRENNIVFIIITDQNGNVISQTEGAPTVGQLDLNPTRALTAQLPLTSINKNTEVFTIAKRLDLQPPPGFMPMMKNFSGNSGMMGRPVEAVISLGLYTKDFDQARRQDVQHAVFMGMLLFLVGSAGLYVLFLYQGMRVAKSTLANMKLYTDNVVESIPVGIVTLDIDERVVSCNRRTEEILGRPMEEIRGDTFSSSFPGCRINVSEICSAVFDYSTECSKSDGTCVPVQIGGSTLNNTEGEMIGSVLVIRDMSLIKEMEQKLERSRRMAALGKMAAGIAHEIRNPLGTLRGFAHYFGNQADSNEESRKYAELMISEVDRLNRNVSGLLQFARPRELNFTLLNLDDLIAKTVALMESDFSQHSLDFHWQCNTNIKFEGDGDLLLQVLMNLLKNSISATPEGGEISLGGTEDEHHVRIIVSDSGRGMNEQERDRMFDPFFTTRKTGTGLGLAVSHQIVEQHRGSFEVETEPSGGTTITIVLPKRR